MAGKTMNMKDKVVGVFLDENHAQQAIQALKSAGYDAKVADESAIGAFRDSGFENDVIDLYRSRLNEGNTIVTVKSGQNGEQALGIMLQNGAEYINLSGQGGNQWDANSYKKMSANQRQYGNVDQATGKRYNADRMRLQLREETLVPVKQAVQSGEVEVRKTVHEKEQTVPVNVTHEEVYIERQAVDRPVAPGEIGDMQDESIRVPVYEEQAQLQKQARVREEVSIGKKAVQEQQNLKGTVRHEHAEVVNSGDVQVRGDTDTNTNASYNADSDTYTDNTSTD